MFESNYRDDYAADREHILEYILVSGFVTDLHICEGYVGSGFLKSDEKTPGGAAAVALALVREDEPYSGGEMRIELPSTKNARKCRRRQCNFDRRNQNAYRLFSEIHPGLKGLFKRWPVRAAECRADKAIAQQLRGAL